MDIHYPDNVNAIGTVKKCAQNKLFNLILFLAITFVCEFCHYSVNYILKVSKKLKSFYIHNEFFKSAEVPAPRSSPDILILSQISTIHSPCAGER